MSLFFNMLSRCHSFSYKECLLFSWLQSPSTMILLQEGGTLPVPKSLTLGNELSKETHRLTKQESLLGRGTWAECSRIRIPGELLCLVACSLWFYDEGIIFQVVFGQSFWLIVLPGGAYIDQPRWMPARRILGVGWTCGVTFERSQTLPVGAGLLVLCSLPRPPIVKQMVTILPDQVIPEWSSGFPYVLYFKSEFCNKEFMMWATVSFQSCFCWLYRASLSLAAKNTISLILVLTIWWCPCVELSLVLLEEGVCYDQCVLLAKLC